MFAVSVSSVLTLATSWTIPSKSQAINAVTSLFFLTIISQFDQVI